MIWTDRDIKACAEASQMIVPFVDRQVHKLDNGHPAISYGVSSFGYDIRLDPERGLHLVGFIQAGIDVIDPKAFKATSVIPLELFSGEEGQWWVMPPHSYVLGLSVERFRMPDYVMGLCFGKSTYARAGIIANFTPLEPGWTGNLVVELSNATDSPVRIYASEGIAQVAFLEGPYPEVTYAKRDGKYQDQEDITYAKV